MISFKIREFSENIISLLDPNGAALIAGSGEHWNAMTLSWGSLGVVWDRPVFIAHVRKNRFTHSILSSSGSFTVNFLGPEHLELLGCLGHHSGRGLDKPDYCQFRVHPSLTVPAPSAEGALYTLECRIIYRSDIIPENISDEEIPFTHYGDPIYHTAFYGEITEITGNGRPLISDDQLTL